MKLGLLGLWIRLRMAAAWRRMRAWTPLVKPVFEPQPTANAWLAAQHFAHGDDPSFEAAVGRAQALTGGSLDPLTDGTLLLRVVAASQQFARGRHDEAARRYRELIATHERLLLQPGRPSNPEERRDTEARRTMLALLHCNLGQTLAAASAAPAKVDREFEQAVALCPTLIYLQQEWRAILLERRDWDGARSRVETIYRLAPSEAACWTRAGSLADLAARQAQAQGAEDKIDVAIETLESALAELTPEAGWLGRLHFQLAEQLRRQQRHPEALAAYARSATCYRTRQNLKGVPDPDPASAAHVEERRGDYLVELQQDGAARQAFDAALADAEALQKTDERVRRLKLKRGLLSRLTGDAAQALADLDDWRRLANQASRWAPYELAESDVRPLASRAAVAGLLKAQLEAWLREPVPAAESRALVDALRVLFAPEPWNPPPAERLDGDPALLPMLNVMTPLAVEAHPSTLAAAGGLGAVIERHQDRLREEVEAAWGVKIPQLRTRTDAPDLPPGGYRILIHEIPRADGWLDETGTACLGPASDLDRLGIRGRPLATRPLIDGRWLAAPEADAARRSGLPVLDPADLLMRHVAEVVAGHLVEFIAHQEVQHLLETHRVMQEGESHKIVSMEAARHMDPLTRVVRTLVAERVPVNEFPAIHDLFERLAGQATPAEIAEAARALPSVRDRLWGNDGSFELFWVGPRLVARLDDGAGVPVAPASTDPVLAAVGAAVATVRKPALVVRQHRHRAALRARLQHALPGLPVLALRELALGRRPGGEVDLDGAPASP